MSNHRFSDQFAANATSSGMTADSMLSLGPILIGLGVTLAALALILVAYRSLESYEKLRGWFRLLGATPALVFEGILGLVPFAALAFAIYLIQAAPPGTGTKVLQVAGFSIGAYAALAAWGLVVRKVRKRFAQHRAALAEPNSAPTEPAGGSA
jgi:hypothetical protein